MHAGMLYKLILIIYLYHASMYTHNHYNPAYIYISINYINREPYIAVQPTLHGNLRIYCAKTLHAPYRVITCSTD